MINLIVNGNSYSYPQPGDKANTGWGSQATNWASAVTAALTALGLGGTLTPTPNAVVDISSTTKGILVPRLTTTQRNAITSPATSLLIFNTTLGVFQYYTGSAWITIGAKIPDNVQFDGTLTVNGNINTNGSITAVGAVSGASLNSTGNANITGNATVDGVIYADDNTTANTPVISFTGDTNTGIGRSAADTLDFITNGNSRFRIESTGQIKAVYESQIGTDYNTQLDNGYLCRAWVNFDGTGTFSPNPSSTKIRASGNVSSITDNGTGDYTVNFTSAMPDANYCPVGFGSSQAGVSDAGIFIGYERATALSTSSIRIYTALASSTRADSAFVFIGIFR